MFVAVVSTVLIVVPSMVKPSKYVLAGGTILGLKSTHALSYLI